ncbi:MAG: hypothetical protein VXX18_02945 [Bacteroidota bacterium]|nr:hypothetical protein [Bacteroidota bacterium]
MEVISVLLAMATERFTVRIHPQMDMPDILVEMDTGMEIWFTMSRAL